MNYKDLIVYLSKKIEGFTFEEKKLKVNEEIQKIVLYSINTSKVENLYFLGGTNLRLCYNLDRYSEDLDFSYHGKNLSIETLSTSINNTFKSIGFDIKLNWNTNTNVYKTFLNVPKIYYDLGLSKIKDESISIKLEIDINPPSYYKTDTKILKSFLGNYTVSNYNISTTFSGKIGAILMRKYNKGRDYYDLLWYFSNTRTKFNLEFLIDSINQYNTLNTIKIKIPKNHKEVCNMILEKVEYLDINLIKDDIKRFTNLENKVLETYLNGYKNELFFNMEKYIKSLETNANIFRL